MSIIDDIPGVTGIRLFLAGIVVTMVIVAAFALDFHGRHVEDRKIDKASVKVEDEAKAGTEANLIKAAIAARGAEDDQRAIDAYVAAHPAQPVRVCNANSGSVGVRQAGTADTATAGAGTGLPAVSQVLGRDASTDATEGVDVSPAVDVILRAAEAVDILYRERQRRDAGAVK